MTFSLATISIVLITLLLDIFNFVSFIIYGSISLTSMWINPELIGLFITLMLQHLEEDFNYLIVGNTYNDLNCRMNTIILNLFPFFFKDKVKKWIQNLRS